MPRLRLPPQRALDVGGYLLAVEYCVADAGDEEDEAEGLVEPGPDFTRMHFDLDIGEFVAFTRTFHADGGHGQGDEA